MATVSVSQAASALPQDSTFESAGFPESSESRSNFVSVNLNQYSMTMLGLGPAASPSPDRTGSNKLKAPEETPSAPLIVKAILPSGSQEDFFEYWSFEI